MKTKVNAAPPHGPNGIRSRTAHLDWAIIASDLDEHGCAVIGPLLTPEQCGELAASYDSGDIFRSRAGPAHTNLLIR